MKRCAIIGGTGLTVLEGLEAGAAAGAATPFGLPSAPLCVGKLQHAEVVFLARHGLDHNIPPHRVNYRANIRALHDAGADRIIAVNAVGAISAEMRPGRVAIPHQIVDYTYGRDHTFFDRDLEQVVHVEFDPPYDTALRQGIIDAAVTAQEDAATEAVYGVTQGPRLETAAEIDRMARDGCDIVGMTAMPEAALAREIGLPYVSICVVVNWAAGRGDGDIHGQMARHLDQGMRRVNKLLRSFLADF